MAGEYFRANKVRALVCIRQEDLQVAVGSAVFNTLKPVLDAHTIHEPLTVELQDQGITNPANTPLTIVLDATEVQINAGTDEIPRAVCVLAVGRDGKSLAAGVGNLGSTSVVHVLERYLARFVPVRIFESVVQTAAAGMADLGDNDTDGGEPKLLFYGFTTGPTRRGTSEAAEFVLHASHFLAALTFSSSLSADVAAGSDFAAPFHTSVIPSFMPAGLPILTPYGAMCFALAGGDASQKDFWGFDVPAGTNNRPKSCGLRSFLFGLANTNQFDWQAMGRADLGGARCTLPTARTNAAAIAALNRIEPFVPAWDNATASSAWGTIAAAVTSIRTQREAGNSTLGVDRSDILGAAGGAYLAAGYRYGVPLTFRLSGQLLRQYTPGRGFASDVASATFGDLFPASFWDLIAQRYASRYSFCLNPMASRAVVSPNQPLLAGHWQFVWASEISQWEDDNQNPVPIRGAILISDRKAGTGAFAGGNPAVGDAGAAIQQMDAVYDSCEPGAFITRSMPAWLADAYRLPSTFAANTMHNKPRAAVTVPWVLGTLALTAATDIVNNIPGANRNAPQATPVASQTTAYRMAKSLYQLERTRIRTAYITGRYRTDIGPGSIVRFEVPADRYVRQAVGGNRDSTVVGRVIRVTISISEERERCETAFAVSFLRSEAESQDPANALFSDCHPYWSTANYGTPWCDSRYIREKLGTRASIADLPLGAQ